VVLGDQQPISQSTYSSTVDVRVPNNTASSTDALQRFVERAEKSGIKLETLPESNV